MGQVAVKWIGSQLMVGVDSFGHPVVTGSWPEQSPEWAGLKPSDLLLLSAAACLAYDQERLRPGQLWQLAGGRIADGPDEPTHSTDSKGVQQSAARSAHFVGRPRESYGWPTACPARPQSGLSQRHRCSAAGHLGP